MNGPTLALVGQLILLGPAFATGATVTFDEPPTRPAAPRPTDVVVARLIEPIACAHRNYAVTRIGSQIEIRYIEPEVDCAVVPTPTPVEVHIGNLPSGVYTLLLLDDTSPYPGGGELDDQSSLTVTALATRVEFDAPPMLPAAPSVEDFIDVRLVARNVCIAPAFTATRVGATIDLRRQSLGDDCSAPHERLHIAVAVGRLPAGSYELRLWDDIGGGEAVVDTRRFTVDAAPCSAPAFPPRLCLQDGRFVVTAEWTARNGTSGLASPSPISDDSGAFWFAGPESLEVLVKLSDACERNFHYWFLAGGATNPNLGVTVRVREVATGLERTYSSPVGKLFQPVRDPGAFDCSSP